MAFIRNYMDQAGDPFRLRLPKKLRKMKVGKSLGKLAKGALRVGASFIPGGSIAQQLIDGTSTPQEAVQQVVEQYPDYESLLQFARSYGYEGDPKPAPSRRKAAAAGPAAKAAKKKEVRNTRHAAATGAAPKKPSGPDKRRNKGGSNLGSQAGNILLGAAKDVPFLGGALNASGFKFGGGGGGGGGRRSINPANVKALKRGLRRVEAFEKMVKRVEKAYPRMKRATGHAPAHRGHKAGCKCVACR